MDFTERFLSVVSWDQVGLASHLLRQSSAANAGPTQARLLMDF